MDFLRVHQKNRNRCFFEHIKINYPNCNWKEGIYMGTNDLIGKNPLGAFKADPQGNDINNRMGLVMARAGLGKTAILVQIALDSMLRGQQVLHVSIGQNIQKAKSWYDDILRDISSTSEPDSYAGLQYEVMRNRMIMTFKESTFSRPKLEERLNDLIYQDIFRPSCIVIDGLDFTNLDRQTLEDMQELQKEANLNIWFSAVSHRSAENELSKEGVPAPCNKVADLFDTVILLQAESNGESKIFLNILKDDTGCVEPGKSLRLDPTSLLVWGSTF
jgi:hypothetical protein